jgi:hypothetical protein
MPKVDPEILRGVGELPDEACVDIKVLSALTGESERSIRRHPPIQPRRFSSRNVRYRIGDYRALFRGNATA